MHSKKLVSYQASTQNYMIDQGVLTTANNAPDAPALGIPTLAKFPPSKNPYTPPAKYTMRYGSDPAKISNSI